MAEEPILFNITDAGSTEALIALLNQLGVEGAAAIDRLNSALPTYVNAANAAADAQKLLNSYLGAGGQNVEGLADNLATLDEVELSTAAASERFVTQLEALAAGELSAAAAARALAAEIAAATTAFGEAITVDNLYRNTMAEIAIAEADAGAAAVKASAGIEAQATAATSASVALKGTTGALTSLTSSLGFYLSAAVVIKADDTWEKVRQQLQDAVGAGNDFSGVYAKLAAGANAAQLPIDQVSRTFGSFAAAGKAAGVSLDVAANATVNFSQLLAVSGVNATQAARLMHDFTEEIATGGNATQALNSILRQSPQLVSNYNTVMGTNISTTKESTATTSKLSEELTHLQDQQNGTAITVAAATAEVTKASTAIKTHTDNITKADQTLADYTVKHGDNTAATAKDTAAWDSNTAAIAKGQSALAKGTADLAVAKQQQQEALTVKINATKAEIDNANAAKANFDIQKLGSTDTAAAIAKLPPVYTTVTGALTVFNNKLVEYVGTSGEANAAIALTTKALSGLADLLPVIVPLVILLGAAFVALKVTALIGEIAALGGALVAAFVANPVVGIVTLIVAGFVAMAYHAGLLDGAITSLKATFLTLTPAVSDNQTAIDKANKSFADHTTSVLDNNKAINTLSQEVLPAATQAIKDHTDAGATAWAAYGASISSAIGAGISSAESLASSFFSWISAKLTALGAALAGAFGGGGGGGGGGAGGARDGATVPAFARGGHYTVPGSGGVDSKLIAVSPGEHVTIQTPEQYRAGKVNPSAPGQRKFANGGTMLNGADAAFALKSSQSVAGFSAVTDADYYTSAAAVAATAATSSPATTVATPDTSVSATVGGDTTSTAATTSSGPTFDAAAYRAALAAYTAKIQDYDPTSLGGVSKPGLTGTWSIPQTRVWSIVNGIVGINPGAVFTSSNGASISGYTEAAIEAKTAAGPVPKISDYMHARDGLSMTIPGGTGVDSRLLQLAVSPGEQVDVKTPQQQRRDADANGSAGLSGRSGIVNIVVHAKDANSFGQSQSQLIDMARRKLSQVY